MPAVTQSLGKPRRLMHIMTVAQSTIFLRGQLGFMSEHGFDVEVITSPGPELDELAGREGVTTVAVPMRRAISPLADLVALWRLIVAIRRFQPEIVHSHTPKAGLLGTLAGRLCRAPLVIYQVHGLPYETKTGLGRRILMASEFVSCRAAHQVYCVSNSVCRRLRADHLVQAKKAIVLGAGSVNGVDAEAQFNPERFSAEDRKQLRQDLGIGPEAVVMGFVGRLVVDKGICELMEAWERFRQDPSMHLLIVGSYEVHDPLPADVRQQLEHKSVHLIGGQSDVSKYYAAMDVLVLPTYREGLPTVLLEAASMALPVIATRVTGCVDAVVDGETGILVSLGSPGELVDAINSYRTSPSRRIKDGQTARERVTRDFVPEDVWRRLLGAYDSGVRR